MSVGYAHSRLPAEVATRVLTPTRPTALEAVGWRSRPRLPLRTRSGSGGLVGPAAAVREIQPTATNRRATKISDEHRADGNVIGLWPPARLHRSAPGRRLLCRRDGAGARSPSRRS